MRRCEGFLLIGVVVGGCVASEPPAPERTGTIRQSVTLNDRIAACSVDPRVVAGVVTSDTCVGADLFLRETFSGNGRSCATCHPVDHNFTIDPAFISQLPSTDPLFVAERNSQLAGLEKPAMMRQFGVILENVDGFAPDPTTHFVLRSVPHTLSLATTITNPPNTQNPPANRTGWSGDGAPGSGALLLRFIHDDGGIRAELIRLAAVEAQDALRVLSEVPNLNPTAKNALSQFIQLAPAFEEPSPCIAFTGEVEPGCTDGGRDSRLDELRSLLAAARNAIGTNMTFQMGDGVLMF